MTLHEEQRRLAAQMALAVPAWRALIAGPDAAPRDRGGWRENPATGVTSGRPTMFFANFLIALLTEPDLPLAADAALADDCQRLLDFVLRRQYRDGSLDLGVWQHAPCESGFCLGAAAAGEHDLRAWPGDFRGRTELADKLHTFITRALPIVRAGPMYTPNHRWAAAVGPLAWVEHFAPDPANRAAIARYLATGLDLDDEGLYFYELSMGGYNSVANRGLLAAGVLLPAPDLVAAVQRNLHASLLFVNPAGDIDTSFSFRQDRGRPGAGGLDFACARVLSVVCADGVLSALADRLRDELLAAPGYRLDNLCDLYWYRHVLRPAGRAPALPAPVPRDGRRHFRTACVYRVRAGDFAVSVKANPPIRERYHDPSDGWCGRDGAANLVSVWHGAAAVDAVMFKVCYQNFQAMKPRGLVVHGDECRMSWHFGGFPLLEAPFLASQAERGYQWGDLRMTARCRVGDRAVELELSAETPPGIEAPATVEFLLRPDGELRLGDGATASAAPPLRAGGVVWFAADAAEYRRDGWGLRLTGGQVEHRWALGDFKLESGWAEANCARLVVSGYTPFRRTFTIAAAAREAHR